MAPPVTEKQFNGLEKRVVYVEGDNDVIKKKLVIQSKQLFSIKKDTDEDRKKLNETSNTTTKHEPAFIWVEKFRGKLLWLAIGALAIKGLDATGPMWETLADGLRKVWGL